MCQFKSAIVLRDEKEKGGFKLLMSPWTESHSELITIHKLNDGKMLHFARVEFSPRDFTEAHKVETYALKIDEDRRSKWFDDDMISAVTAKMSDYVKRMIVTGDVELLIGGQFIIAPGAKVECAKAVVINAMWGGTLTAMWGGTLTEVWKNFKGIIGKITKPGKIDNDNRK